MWKIKDWFRNAGLAIRLWFYVTFKSKKLNNDYKGDEKKGWDLTFFDDFNDTKLDYTKWRTDAYYGLRYHPRNILDKNIAPDVYYSNSNFEFTGNSMKQVVKKENVDVEYVDWDGINHGKYTIPYTVGQIDSSNSFSQKYGYFEIRSKITDQPGSWPAFWLASTENWPPEIDIYEIYTGRKRGKKSFSSNFHWRNEKGDKTGTKHNLPHRHKTYDVSEDFHIYACEWNEKGFKIYYDGVLVRVFTNPKAVAFFDYPMHIIINSAIHVEQGPENAAYPNYHEVDYVRAYKTDK